VTGEAASRAAARDRIWPIAERVARDSGLEIFDIQFRRESHGWVLRVIIDRPFDGTVPTAEAADRDPYADSIGIAECQKVSTDLSAILDVEDDSQGLSLPSHYTLEVSSPGLDRPLRGAEDYRRFRGRLAKIVSREPVDGQSAFAGRIKGLAGDAILLVEGRRTHRIPLALVARAQLDVEF